MSHATKDVVIAVGSYSLCSSLMLVVNKMAVASIPVPSLVTIIQLLFCTLVVLALKYGGAIKVS